MKWPPVLKAPAFALGRSWYPAVPMGVLLMVIGLSTVLWWRDRALTDMTERQKFDQHAQAIQSEIVSRLNRIQDLLWVVRAELSQSPEISNSHWQRFIGDIYVSERFPGISGIGLITYLQAGQLENFVARRRRDVPSFHVFPEGARPFYMVVTFISQPRNMASLGLDAATNPERRAALEESRDTGQVIFSHKVTGLKEGNIIAYLPIYAQDLPTSTKEERQNAITGWAGIAFSLETLMNAVTKPGDQTDIEVFDGDIRPENMLMDSDSERFSSADRPNRLEYQTSIPIAGRNYILYIGSAAMPSHAFMGSAIVLGVGSILLLVLMQKFIATLRQKEERLRLVLESSKDGHWDWDIASGTVFFSPHFAEMLGFAANEVLPRKKSWENLVHPDDLPVIRQAFIAHLRGDTARIEHEYRLRDRDGNWLWVREAAAVVKRVGHRAVRMSGVITDISESRDAEDRLRLLSTAMEESPASVVITNAEGVILYVNHMFTKITGHSFAEAIGQKPTIIASGLTPQHVYEEMWAAISNGREWRGELCNRKKDGELYWESIFVTQVRGYDGTIFYLGVKEDITERKKSETVLLHSQKMEAIGVLAGGIAHDFNNILTSILGFNHLILGDLGNPKAVSNHVQQIHLAAGRAKDLVRQILTFSRQIPSQKTIIDLCQIVGEVYQLIRTTAPPTIKIALVLPPGKAMVLGTTIQLHQVLMNLCLNAIDAIECRSGGISIMLEALDDTFNLSVEDSGCGIREDVRSKIFDPFFTTKNTGMGTGLGLSVVHGIVKDLGGTITVDCPPEGGTRFEIRIPKALSTEQVASAAEPSAFSGSAIAAQHILVVDDDPAIVDLLRQFFERMGHRVTAAALSVNALEMIRRGDRFDIVVTDQMMPDVTGTELAQNIFQYTPGTKVLLCSGRDDMIDYDEISESHVDGFLLKPFNLIELADTVECLLRS